MYQDSPKSPSLVIGSLALILYTSLPSTERRKAEVWKVLNTKKMKEVVSFQSLPHWLSHAIPSTVPRSPPSSSLSCHSTPKVTQEADSSTHQAYSSKYPMKLHTAKARFTRTRSCRFPRTRSCPSPWPVTKQPSFSADFEKQLFSLLLDLPLVRITEETLSSLKLQAWALSWSLPTCSRRISRGPSAAFPGAEGLRNGSITSAGKCPHCRIQWHHNDIHDIPLPAQVQAARKQEILESLTSLFFKQIATLFDSFRGFTASKNLAI